MKPTIFCVLYDGDGPYEASWVDKLYRGVARNTTKPFDFVCLSDRWRSFDEPVILDTLRTPEEGWMNLLEPFRLGAERGILFGLDTVITGNIDFLLRWRGSFGVLRDPYAPSVLCNGVLSWCRSEGYALWAEWNRDRGYWREKCRRGMFYEAQKGRASEMVFLRHQYRTTWQYLDDLFPGAFCSWKVHGLTDDTRVLYFHGEPRPCSVPQIADLWV